jgi:hypothetical protein
MRAANPARPAQHQRSHLVARSAAATRTASATTSGRCSADADPSGTESRSPGRRVYASPLARVPTTAAAATSRMTGHIAPGGSVAIVRAGRAAAAPARSSVRRTMRPEGVVDHRRVTAPHPRRAPKGAVAASTARPGGSHTHPRDVRPATNPTPRARTSAHQRYPAAPGVRWVATGSTQTSRVTTASAQPVAGTRRAPGRSPSTGVTSRQTLRRAAARGGRRVPPAGHEG